MSKLVVIDGLDGSGKGTQINLLKKHFDSGNILFTREPGGTDRTELIRGILMSASLPESERGTGGFGSTGK